MSTYSEVLSVVETDLREATTDVVTRAVKAGATAAEAVVRQDSKFSTLVRFGQVETVKYEGARAIGLRVFLGRRAASTYSSDFSGKAIADLVKRALDLAKVTSEDPYVGLPEASQLGSLPGDLKLYYEDVYSLPPEQRIDYARRAERAALAADPRIKNSAGGFEAMAGRTVLANSFGFIGDYSRSLCTINVAPVAHDENGRMQRDYWYSSARSLAQLESPECVGKRTAQKTLRRLGARKIASTRVPLIFDPRPACALLKKIFQAFNGDAVDRHASFLYGKLGEKIAAENVTVVDDGTIPGGFGTSPFDAEGVRTGRTVVIERGVLKSYLLNTYAARKLGMQTTGNAYRGLVVKPKILYSNFFLQNGATSPPQMISEVRQGLYVTNLLGNGVNPVTGDCSQGAAGIWVENGELTYPVEEITIAGNLKEMLKNISEIGDDLEFRSAISSPTLRIDGMTIAGH